MSNKRRTGFLQALSKLRRGSWGLMPRANAVAANVGSVHLFGQHLAAQALVVTLYGCSFEALALGCWLFVELA